MLDFDYPLSQAGRKVNEMIKAKVDPILRTG